MFLFGRKDGRSREKRIEGRREMEGWIEEEREKKEGREGGRTTPWSIFFKDTNPMVASPPP